MDPELAQRFDEIGQRFELLNVRLDARFEAIDRRFETIDGRFEAIDQRFGAIDGRFEELKERIEEVKRHSGGLVEGLRHEVHLLAEGLMTHIDVRHAEDRAYVDQKFQVTDNLIRLAFQSTDQLRQRVENLERRDQN